MCNGVTFNRPSTLPKCLSPLKSCPSCFFETVGCEMLTFGRDIDWMVWHMVLIWCDF